MTDEQDAVLKLMLAYINNADKFDKALSGIDPVFLAHVGGKTVFERTLPGKPEFDAFESWNRFDLDEAVDENTAPKN